MSITAVIFAVIGAISSGVVLYFRVMRNRQSERDQNLGRLQQRDKQHDQDSEALHRSKRIEDEVEALDNVGLRAALRRFVRK